jgi:hypothetical protein
MSSISDPSQIGGWFGPGGWYRATGESVTAPDGSIAWKYTNPYTWLDGSDRNQGNEVVMWAIELRTPLTVAPVPRGLYLVPQNISPPQTFTIPPSPPPTDVSTKPPTDPGGGDITAQTPEPSYALLIGLMLLVLALHLRRRIRA